jgi:hypothetical protein
VVALGKFDAMHRGHAQLASRAAQMGAPYLMSFGGMAAGLHSLPSRGCQLGYINWCFASSAK